jgi:chromosomal replication initiator protein
VVPRHLTLRTREDAARLGGCKMPPVKDLPPDERSIDLSVQLQSLVDERAWQHWFQGKTRLETDADALCVTVGNPYLLTWIQKRFQPVLRELACQHIGPEARLRFIVDAAVVTDCAATKRPRAATQKSVARTLPPPGSRSASRRRVYADLRDFVAGECNELAFAAAQQVAADPSGQYNPLYIHAGVGSGKTHLLEGIYQKLRNEQPHLQVLLLTAENFGNYFSCALREKTLPSFRQRFRNVDVLLVDDVDFFDGKRGFQEEFLHTFRKLEGDGRQMIVTASCHPRLLTKTSDELISRYLAGLVCRVELPDLDTRRSVLRQRAVRLQLPLDDKAVEFIVERFTGSLRELLGAANCLHTWHRMSGRRVTAGAARDVLARLERDCIRIVRISDIDDAVCRLFGVTSDRLKSAARSRDLTQPRMLAMYLARRLTRAPYSEIGAYFGGRNHATVISAERKITRLLDAQACICVSNEEWPLAELVTTIQQQVLAG